MTEKNIIVSGASSGIGRAISTRLLQQGYRVTGVARDFSKFPCDDLRFTPVCMDLSNLDELPARLDALVKKDTVIDGLICCAGSGRFGSLEEFSAPQIRQLLDLNLTSQLYLVRALLPGMKQRGSGNIVFMGSEAALAGGKRGAVYSAAKFGLRGLAQALRQECAASGLRVSIINPGMVQTEFFNELDFRPGEAPDNYILPDDVALAVQMILEARQGTVFDEINLSPQKKVVRFPKPGES
ncbi:MAG: SDR family oxidoreductase [Gammaproteobacteria bacterium]|nr:SDR family oxidoreductase [Gammaproteobacteria bacterium]MDH3887136.1 SDR family oxidoreductase [Gammaproteobacteria bacterium]MDH3971661.1 SDR family oxidoreductase [Gammaproteobacteria bacterium]MDH3986586.1 SDR family oxidoreductase [Gammaproteobacteria bacterium]